MPLPNLSYVVCEQRTGELSGRERSRGEKINQLGRETCTYLEWHLDVPAEDLEKLEQED